MKLKDIKKMKLKDIKKIINTIGINYFYNITI